MDMFAVAFAVACRNTGLLLLWMVNSNSGFKNALQGEGAESEHCSGGIAIGYIWLWSFFYVFIGSLKDPNDLYNSSNKGTIFEGTISPMMIYNINRKSQTFL